MNDEITGILASNIANQAITIAKLQSENNQLKKLLIKTEEVKDSEHTKPDATDR